MTASGQSSHNILAISGSLRAASFNTALLHALRAQAPASLEIDVYHELADIPHFNSDLEDQPPPVVERLRAAVRAADGLIISTPEYNRGIPGVLKDAIDWAARPLQTRALQGKPIAVLSASPGQQGGIRAQVELRRILTGLENFVVHSPEVAVSEVGDRLGRDADGGWTLTDKATANLGHGLLAGLLAAIEADAGRLTLAGKQALASV